MTDRGGRCRLAVVASAVVLVVTAMSTAVPAAAQGAPLERPVVAVDLNPYSIEDDVITRPRAVVFEPDGSRWRLVEDEVGRVAYAPDATRIAYQPHDTATVGVVDADGSGNRRIAVERTMPANPWSPDATEVLVIDPGGRVEAVHLDTGVAREIFTTDEGAVTDAVWSPTGARVAVTVRGADDDADTVWSMIPGGGEPARLDVLAVGHPAWSPDGTSLAYTRFAEEGERHAVVVFDLVRGERRVLEDVAVSRGTPQAPDPLWSPDSSSVAVLDRGLVAFVDARSGATTRVDPGGGSEPAARLLVDWTDPAGPLVRVAGGSDLVQVGQDGTVTPRLEGLPQGGIDVAPVATQTLPATVARSLWWSRQRPDASAPTVLLGRADGFADSLASGAAQGVLDAPLLLTATGALHPAVTAELARLGTTRVVILGGTAAIAPAVEQDLRNRGLEVQRLAGDTRLATAVAVADATVDAPTRVIVARAFGDPEDPSRGFADSLAAGALAAGLDAPLLLTDTAAPSPELTSWLERTTSVEEVLVIGGPAAVSDAVVDELTQRGRAVVRIGGETRIQTAAAVRAFGIEAEAGDDRPPPPGGLLALVQADDPLGWADGFAVAGQADPTVGGGVLLANAAPPLAVPTLAGLLDAPPSSVLGCASMLPSTACGPAEAARSAGIAGASLHARVTDGNVIADAVVAFGDAVCIDATLEGAELAGVTVTGTDVEMPTPVQNRTIACGEMTGPEGPKAGDTITFTTADGRALTGTFDAV